MLGAWYSRGAVALLIALAAVVPRPAQAAISASCADLRNKIVTMENAVPSGAAASVDLGMRRVYNEDCLRHPSDGRTPGSAASDPWFDAKGDPASGPPPDGNGVFQTTPQIAGYCQGSSDPQLCALMLNIGEGKMLTEGGDPKDPNDWVPPTRDIDPADALPPFRLSAGGRTFPIDDACLSGLASLKVLQAVEEFKQTTNGKMVKALVSDQIWDDGNPQHLFDGVVGVLRRHYPKAELVDDIATAKKRGFRTTVVADIQYHHLVTAFDSNHVTLTYVVMDADENPVSRFSGEGTSHTFYGSTDPHFRDAVAMAIANLDAKATQLLQGGGK